LFSVTVNCWLEPATVNEIETALPPIGAGTGVGVGLGVGVGVGAGVGVGVGVGAGVGVGVGVGAAGVGVAVGVAVPVKNVGGLELPPPQPATSAVAATIRAAVSALRLCTGVSFLFARISVHQLSDAAGVEHGP
jgi:hypothetical protein